MPPATPDPDVGILDWFADMECRNLAPWAAKSVYSAGRFHKESGHPRRTIYHRDRDRIIHSRAFRRLEYKTQVFVTGLNDHFRTRLTHTIEVAGIARTVARCLRLNEDLAEAVALAHDLGHPPFGHCGERALNRLLVDHGGFDHNRQALRIVDLLELKYPDYPGLNLSYEVRSGLLKHRRDTLRLDDCALLPQAPLEAQAADCADGLTYLTHDLDDGFRAGLLSPDKLADLALWQRAMARPPQLSPDHPRFVPMAIRALIDLLVEDLVTTSSKRLDATSPGDAVVAQRYSTPLIAFSAEIADESHDLKAFLFEHLYHHPSVDDDNQRAVDWMCQLFQLFVDSPDKLPIRHQQRISDHGLHRAVADHVAAMTDRYAIEQYQRFAGGA
jgi:dGTPase